MSKKSVYFLTIIGETSYFLAIYLKSISTCRESIGAFTRALVSNGERTIDAVRASLEFLTD